MSRKVEYLEALEAAILIKHKCKPTHRETVFVREETREKETVWVGYVDAFALTGHQQAKTCYAWQHTDGKGGVKIFAVLENQFVDSAKRAVQAAIFMGAQPMSRKSYAELELSRQELEEYQNALRKTWTKIEVLDDPTSFLKGASKKIRPRSNSES
jgi:hypothetical protein